MRKTASRLLLPHGLDDLAHGVEQLLTNCTTAAHREAIADVILRDLDGMAGTAAPLLALAVSRYAAWGGDPEPVREAFHRFAVDAGPYIGAKNRTIAAGAAGGKKQAAQTNNSNARLLGDAMARVMRRRQRKFKDIAALIQSGVLQREYPNAKENTLRAWLRKHRDLPEWVDTLPPTRR